MRKFFLLSFCIFVGACGMENLVPDDVAAVSKKLKSSDNYTALYFDNAFAFTEDGILKTLPSGKSQGAINSFSGNGLEYVATKSSDYVVIGGRLNGERITSISDSYTPVSLRGKAEFTGQATVLDQGVYDYVPLTLVAHFGAATPHIRNKGGQMDVYGAINRKGNVDGSVAFKGTEAKMRGGFFGNKMQIGAHTFAAGFAGGTLTGIIVVEQ